MSKIIITIPPTQKREIEKYLDDLALDREACETWEEEWPVRQAIHGVMDILGILGYWVDEKSGHFTIGRD